MAGHGYPCQNIWQLTKTCYARRQRRPARHSGAGRQTSGPDGWTGDAKAGRQADRQAGGHIIPSHSSSISLGSPKFKLIPSLAHSLSLSLYLSRLLLARLSVKRTANWAPVPSWQAALAAIETSGTMKHVAWHWWRRCLATRSPQLAALRLNPECILSKFISEFFSNIF